MGNRLVCCRLSWRSFANSEDDLISRAEYQSRFQFTNHGAYFPPIITTVQPSLNVFEDNSLAYCQKSPDSRILQASVQHISEREPEDLDFNPSLNASNTTLFLHSISWSIGQSSPLQKMLYMANKERKKHEKKSGIQRWSSCGTVYIGEGCLSRPDSKLILHCISVAVCSLIKTERLVKNPKLYKSTFSDRDPLIEANSSVQSPSLTSTYNMGNECSIPLDFYKEVYEIYDERAHPLFPTSFYCQLESHFSSHDYPFSELRFQHQILYFLNRLFSSSLLTAESAIVSLVYLERLISSLEMYVVAWSWRRQLLACILIASKVLDDQAVWNADYCQLLKDVQVEDLNDLERHTLSLLQFNTGIPPAVYARYYFDLLTLADLVALPSAGGEALRRRRRLTPRVARHLRIIPLITSSDQRSGWAGCGTGGGGVIFDLPLSSIAFSDEDAEKEQKDKRYSEGPVRQKQLKRRRAHSASSLLSPTLARQLSASRKSSSRHHHEHSQRGNCGNEYDFANYCSPGSSTSASNTSSSSESSTWKSSRSSSTFSTNSGCFRMPSSTATTAAVPAFDPWTPCTSSSTRDDSTTLFLLQQDSGLY